MKLLSAFLSTAIASVALSLAPVPVNALLPFPQSAYKASPISFAKGSYCGTVANGRYTEQFYKISVKKGQTIKVAVTSMYLHIINPKGKQMEIDTKEYNDANSLYYYTFTTLHSGYYTIVPAETEGYTTPPFMVVCAK